MQGPRIKIRENPLQRQEQKQKIKLPKFDPGELMRLVDAHEMDMINVASYERAPREGASLRVSGDKLMMNRHTGDAHYVKDGGLGKVALARGVIHNLTGINPRFRPPKGGVRG